MEEEIMKILRTSAALIGISALAAASRSILSEDRRSFGGFMRGLVLAIFVGSLVGLLIQDFDFSPPTQGGIVGVAAFVADDLLMMIINISRKLRDDPMLIINYIFKRGGQ